MRPRLFPPPLELLLVLAVISACGTVVTALAWIAEEVADEREKHADAAWFARFAREKR